jgi:hypothetical protein
MNDPLEILIVPHAVVEWQKQRGLLMKQHLPNVVRRDRENGKWAIFHRKLRLRELFISERDAWARINEIVGNKKKCWKNLGVYTVSQL